MRLKSHKVIHRALIVLLTELNDGIRLGTGSRIGYPYRLQRTVAKSVKSPSRHYLDRHAALENRKLILSVLSLTVEIVKLGFLRRDKLVIEAPVFLARHRTVYIVCVTLAIS